MESVYSLLNVEDKFVLLDWSIDVTDLSLPSSQIIVLPLLQWLLEIVSDLLKLFTLIEVFPVCSKDIFNSFHVDGKSSLDLLGPNNFVWDIREASDPVEHGRLVIFLVLVVKKFFSEDFDILFDLDK